MDVEIVTPRDVPLGGPRAMTVRRTLPQRARSLIGPWCFVDHYGPDDVGATGGMDVPPHPHTGLQTVSWLFEGEIEHRDSLGMHAMVRPGELNLMTGGHGVAHSEVSTSATTTLHGVQLWLALPDSARHVPRDFVHHVPTPVRLDCGVVRLLLGSLAGDTSPVPTHSPMVGAEVVLDPGAEMVLDLDTGFEHGVLVDLGPVAVDDLDVKPAELAYLRPGREHLVLGNPGDDPARMLLIGGPPFGEDIIMWWNFVGRTHEDIVEAREEWQAHSDRFGAVEGYTGEVQHLPAPPLPNSRLKPRVSEPASTDRSAWG